MESCCAASFTCSGAPASRVSQHGRHRALQCRWGIGTRDPDVPPFLLRRTFRRPVQIGYSSVPQLIEIATLNRRAGESKGELVLFSISRVLMLIYGSLTRHRARATRLGR